MTNLVTVCAQLWWTFKLLYLCGIWEYITIS